MHYTTHTHTTQQQEGEGKGKAVGREGNRQGKGEKGDSHRHLPSVVISSRRSCLNPVAAGSRDIDGGGGGSGDGSGSGNVVVAFAFVDNGVVVVVG